MEYNFLNKTILIVEDEEDSRFLLEKTLQKTKAEVIYVNNGLAALSLVESKPDIDLVLIDIRLPVMDGITATVKIKELNPQIPIIVQTAYAMNTTREEAISSGCDDFITKPIDTDSLLKVLNKYLHN